MESGIRIGRSIVGLGVGAYLVSFLLPAYWWWDPFDQHVINGTGIEAFVNALIGGNETLLAWLANPLMWVALGLSATGRYRSAAITATLGLFLSLYGVEWLMSNDFHPQIAPFIRAASLGLVSAGSLGTFVVPRKRARPSPS